MTTILHGDEFSRPRSERPVSPDEPSDYYESIDYSALFSLIFPAARSGAPQTLGIRQTDWERDDWQTVRLNLSNVDVLVVEGAFLFREGRQREFDLSLWLEIGWELALERAASRPRDVERFGSPTAVRERYETRYLPAQQMHLERDHPKRGVTMVVRSPQAPS